MGRSVSRSLSLQSCLSMKVQAGSLGQLFFSCFLLDLTSTQSHAWLCGLFLHAASCSHHVVTLALGNSRHINQSVLYTDAVQQVTPELGDLLQEAFIWMCMDLAASWDALLLVPVGCGLPHTCSFGTQAAETGGKLFLLRCLCP